MPYQLAETSSSRVVFRQTKFYKRFFTAFVLIAFLFLCGGITGLILSDSSRSFFLIFSIIAALLFYLGWFIPSQRNKFDPYEIIFDNTKGRVEIVQAKEGNTKAYILYEEIARFAIRVKSESRTNSSSRSISTRYYRYYVHLLKKDGGTWDLLETATEAQAQQLLEKITAAVNLQQASVSPGHAAPGEKIELETMAGISTLHWKNPVLLPLLLFIPTAGVIGTVLYYFWVTFASQDFFFKLILGFMGCIFVFVLVANGIRLWKDSFRRYGLRITPSALEYFEEAKKGEARKLVSYALTDIGAVVYHFMEGSFDSDIYILQKEEAALHGRMVRGETGFSEIAAAIRSSMKTMRLRLTRLNCTEHLQVENWIQEEIAKRTGRPRGEL